MKVMTYVRTNYPNIYRTDLATHFIWAFAEIEDGEAYILNTTNLINFINNIRKTSRSTKIILGIGGWGCDGFSDAALTPESRATFALSIKNLILQYNLNGVDLDWEYPGRAVEGVTSRPSDPDNFILLLEEIRSQIPSPKYHLSIAVGNYYEYTQVNDMWAASLYLDAINIMCYDFSDGSSHASNLFNSLEFVNFNSCDDVLTRFKGIHPDRFTPTEDAYVYDFVPDENYNGVGLVVYGGGEGDNQSALLKFDISSLIEAYKSTSSAVIRLYVPAAGDGLNISIKRITSEWDEETLTFNTMPTLDANVYTSKEIEGDAGWKEFNVTDLITDALNGETFYGLYIYTTNVDYKSIGFSSKDGDYSPLLLINVEDSEKVIPPDKLILGFPAYGKQYDTVGGDWSLLDKGYNELVAGYINKNGWTRQWDDVAKQPYLTKDGQQSIFYEDAESLIEKCNYVKQIEIGGMFYWRYDLDNEYELLLTISQNLIGGVSSMGKTGVATPYVPVTMQEILMGEANVYINKGLPNEKHLGNLSGGLTIDVERVMRLLAVDGFYGPQLSGDGYPMVRYDSISPKLTLNQLYLRYDNKIMIPMLNWDDDAWATASGGNYIEEETIKLMDSSVKCSVTDSDGEGCHNVFDSDLDLSEFSNGEASTTDDFIGFGIYITTAELAKLQSTGVISLRFNIDAEGTETNYYKYDVTGDDLTADQWTLFKVAKSGFTGVGSPNWTAIKGVSLAVSGTDGTVEFYVDAIMLLQDQDDSAVVPVEGGGFKYTQETYYKKYYMDLELPDEAYIRNITVCGKKMGDGDLPFHVVLENCLSDDNISLALQEKSEVVQAAVFKGHYSRLTPTKVPLYMKSYKEVV